MLVSISPRETSALLNHPALYTNLTAITLQPSLGPRGEVKGTGSPLGREVVLYAWNPFLNVTLLSHMETVKGKCKWRPFPHLSAACRDHSSRKWTHSPWDKCILKCVVAVTRTSHVLSQPVALHCQMWTRLPWIRATTAMFYRAGPRQGKGTVTTLISLMTTVLSLLHPSPEWPRHRAGVYHRCQRQERTPCLHSSYNLGREINQWWMKNRSMGTNAECQMNVPG